MTTKINVKVESTADLFEIVKDYSYNSPPFNVDDSDDLNAGYAA